MNSHRTGILSIIILFLVACNGLPPPTTTPALNTDRGLHFLIASEGSESAQIKRIQRGWDAFHPASFGTTVGHGDLIQPPSDGSATILCADLTVHLLEEETGSPCQVEDPRLFYDDVRIINPMAPSQPLPYIIHPRNTGILDDHPWLRWHDTGASNYTVSIIARGEAIWQQTGVTGNELRYPDDAPSLQPGIYYLLEVVDNDTGIASSQEPLRGLGFQLFASEKVAEMNRVEIEIRALPLDAAEQDFALAIYYGGQDVNGAALDLLNDISTVRSSPLLHLWRGDLFLAARLYPQAQAAYIDAFSLAETRSDLEAQAQAQASLWRVTQDKIHFDAAIALYRQLGDEQAINDLQEDIS